MLKLVCTGQKFKGVNKKVALVAVLCDFGRFDAKLADVNSQQSIGMFLCVLLHLYRCTISYDIYHTVRPV